MLGFVSHPDKKANECCYKKSSSPYKQHWFLKVVKSYCLLQSHGSWMHMPKGKSSRHGIHRYNCDQNIFSAGSSSSPAPASCPKECYKCVFLLIFQAILLIKGRFNFFKKLNRSERVCLKIKGSFQTYPKNNTSSPAALLINKMKQICFAGLQEITA